MIFNKHLFLLNHFGFYDPIVTLSDLRIYIFSIFFQHINLYSMNLLLIMQEIHLSSYQCYRMGQLKSVKTKNYLDVEEIKPICPPSKLAMRVIADKNAVPIKTEKVDQTLVKLHPATTQLKTFPAQNVKIKVSGVRFFSQQAVLKST